MGLLEQTKRYRKTYKNWISVMWATYRNMPRIKLKLRNGLELEGNPTVAKSISGVIRFGGEVRRASVELIEFTLNGKFAILYGYSCGDLYVLRDYDRLNVKGRRVLDVGASIGDTAVYFALKGAKEVVAFEPYPFPYGFALKNVEANGLKNVKVINAGISGRDDTVRVTRGETTIGDNLKPSDEPNVVEIPIYSLDRVLEEYGPFDVMKMDCEGCEYDAIANSKRISEIKQIQIEYHYGAERLVDILKSASFDVRATKPRKSNNSRAADADKCVEYLYAWKGLVPPAPPRS